MIVNKISYAIDSREISIKELSRRLEMDYASTHHLVRRKDLGDTKLRTLVAVAKVLDIEVSELYEIK